MSEILKKLVFNRILSRGTSQIFCRRLSRIPAVSCDDLLKFDLVVVGGGIVGCATARQMKISNPHLSVVILEKESHLAAHQSGNNSGVLHAGIYYTPGTLKAKLCVRGIDLAYKYFDEHALPYKRIGKLIVAVEADEIPRLEVLFKRAQQNKCRSIQLVDKNEIPKYATYCKGLKALWSPYTGIVDWGLVTRSFAGDFEKLGGTVYTDYSVDDLYYKGESESPRRSNDFPVVISSIKTTTKIHCKYLITCAGLQSDRIAQLSGCSSLPKIIPFRGEYLLLKPEKHHLVETNIYPVPDSRFPFLGVHFTPRMDGTVWLGPNAVLAYKREGYKYTDISVKDFFDAVTFRGMRKLAWKFFGYGAKEMYRGLFIGSQVKQLRRYVPELTVGDVMRGPAGVRAQAMDREGNLVEDFVFDGGFGNLGSRILHVRNAPSPGATSSLAIAEMINKKAAEKFDLNHLIV